MYTDYCKEYNIDLRSDAYLILLSFWKEQISNEINGKC